MDPLSDVLAMLRVTSLLASRFEGRGAWNLRFEHYDAQIKFGCVLAGRLALSADTADAAPTWLETGDYYLLTNGRPFRTTTAPDRPVLDGARTYRDHKGADGVVRYGADGPLVSLASGRFTFEGEASELLLRHLPPFLHLRAGAPGTEALAGLLHLLRAESVDSQPGAGVARASLASLVLVHALRVFLAHDAQPEGWLGALRDARIGAALARMHGDPAQAWTVASLADAVGMSRTAFAVRFKQRVGATPLDYLGAWRMRLAQRALRESDAAISQVAEQVGYRSDTSFNAAFKRAIGLSPGRYRSAREAPTAEQAPPEPVTNAR